MDVAAAIADPVRREIVAMLARQELTAGEIAAGFSISRPAVSRHLRVLREAGLVVDEARGRNRVSRLDFTPLVELATWIHSITDPWANRLDALETEVYRTRRERTRGAAATPEHATPQRSSAPSASRSRRGAAVPASGAAITNPPTTKEKTA